MLIISSVLFFFFVGNANAGLSPVPSDALRNNDFTFLNNAIQKLWDDRAKSGYTPLRPLKISSIPNLQLYFKDESASTTGNLKHRFAWCLFLWGLIEGRIGRNTTIFEASSGNTATSEAYFSQLIGVPFTAVIPTTTDQQKIEKIKKYGGNVIKTKGSDIFERAASEAVKNHGFFMDQFKNAHFAEEFHESAKFQLESSNVFHEIVNQLQSQKPKVDAPTYFIHSAGTGGTISSVGRYIRKYKKNTQIILADTEFSIYYDYALNGLFKNESGSKYWVDPGMHGTGFGFGPFPAVLGNTTSLIPSVIDRGIKIPDLASTAGMHVLKTLGINGGTSTGLNFVAALSIAAKHAKKDPKNPFQIVTIIADSGDLYKDTYFNKKWIAEEFKPHGGLNTFECWKRVLLDSVKTGAEPLVSGQKKCHGKRARRYTN